MKLLCHSILQASLLSVSALKIGYTYIQLNSLLLKGSTSHVFTLLSLLITPGLNNIFKDMFWERNENNMYTAYHQLSLHAVCHHVKLACQMSLSNIRNTSVMLLTLRIFQVTNFLYIPCMVCMEDENHNFLFNSSLIAMIKKTPGL